jgi:hypothetical protein
MQPKILFTDINDIEYNILLNTDIDSISKLIHFKQTSKIIDDNNFWLEKFKHDDIPIITKRTDYRTWIEEYKKVQTSIDLANKILIINDIEMNTEEYGTSGWISVNNFSTTSQLYKDAFLNICNKNIFPANISDHLKNLDTSMKFNINIGINQNDKRLNVFVYNVETDNEGEFTQTITYKEINNFITKAVYYGLRITDDGFDDGLEFIIPNKDFKQYDYESEKYYAYRRYGYWEMLNTLDKNTIQFLLNNVKSKLKD